MQAHSAGDQAGAVPGSCIDLGRGHHWCVAWASLPGHQSPPPGLQVALVPMASVIRSAIARQREPRRFLKRACGAIPAQGLRPKGARETQRPKTAVLLLWGRVVRENAHKGSSGVAMGWPRTKK